MAIPISGGPLTLSAMVPEVLDSVPSQLFCDITRDSTDYTGQPSPDNHLHQLVAGGGGGSTIIRHDSPLAVGAGVEIPYLFSGEGFIAREAVKHSDLVSAMRMVERKLPGPEIPSRLGHKIRLQDGWQIIYETSSPCTANLVHSYIPFGTAIAERMLMIQEVLSHYDIPHLPLRKDARALALARHGITLQTTIPTGAAPLDKWAMEGARIRPLAEAYRKKKSHPPLPDEIVYEFQKTIPQAPYRRPTTAQMMLELSTEIESGLGASVREELDALLEKIDQAENNLVLKESARARKWLVFPGEPSLIHFDGGGSDWTYNIFYDPNGPQGKRWFLVSW